MRIVRLTAMAMAVGCIAQASLADDLPRFDIPGFCAANASLRGAAACRREEEAIRVQIAARWTKFSKQRKHFCVQAVSFRRKNQRSYVYLAECLEDTKTM